MHLQERITRMYEATNAEQVADAWYEDPAVFSIVDTHVAASPNPFFGRPTLLGIYAIRDEYAAMWEALRRKQYWTFKERALFLISLAKQNMDMLCIVQRQFPHLFTTLHVDEYCRCLQRRERIEPMHVPSTPMRCTEELFTAIGYHDAEGMRCALERFPQHLVARVRDRHGQTPLENLLSIRGGTVPGFFETALRLLLPFETKPWPLSEVYVVSHKLLQHPAHVHVLQVFWNAVLDDIERFLRAPFMFFPFAHRLIRSSSLPQSKLVTLLQNVTTERDRFGDSLISWAMFMQKYHVFAALYPRDRALIQIPCVNGRYPLAHLLQRQAYADGIKIVLEYFLWTVSWETWKRRKLLSRVHGSWVDVLARRGICPRGVAPHIHILQRDYCIQQYLIRYGIRRFSVSKRVFPEVIVDTLDTVTVNFGSVSVQIPRAQAVLSNVLHTMMDLDPAGEYPVAAIHACVLPFLMETSHPGWFTKMRIPSEYRVYLRNRPLVELLQLWHSAHYMEIARLEILLERAFKQETEGVSLRDIRDRMDIPPPRSEYELQMIEFENAPLLY